ncbi:MAG: Hsp33 family molecular chaperone [Rhizobiales bacterium]|nr:Hsp33 family molecular chaperone [Hyphomicrobiales bacterium]
MPVDNLVLPFAIRSLGIRGRVVRLGSAANDIIHRHNYPPSVSALLAEAIALTAMLGGSLKFDGKFILQASTNGAVTMLVCDFTTPGQIRGYAQFDDEKVAGLEATGDLKPADLFGSGHLAMTIDQGQHTDRYQGIVALNDDTLSDAAHRYFLQSEQIPTRLRIVSGPLMSRGAAMADTWRAGAIMVQHLPDDGGISAMEASSGDAPAGSEEEVAEDDNWVKARVLMDTVEDHELLDPTLAPEQLLYRLYHEDGVMVFPAVDIRDECSCSRERIETVLGSFSDEERADMTEDGMITVTCEFCSSRYAFAARDVA